MGAGKINNGSKDYAFALSEEETSNSIIKRRCDKYGFNIFLYIKLEMLIN